MLTEQDVTRLLPEDEKCLRQFFLCLKVQKKYANIIILC